MLLSKLCFDYREDILFREYVLRYNDKAAWREFCNLPSNRKAKYKKLFVFHKSIKKLGQKTPIFVLKKNSLVYPLNGATRLACLLALDKRTVKVTKKVKTTKKWNESFNLNTHHFRGMSAGVIDRFRVFLDERRRNEGTG